MFTPFSKEAFFDRHTTRLQDTCRTCRGHAGLSKLDSVVPSKQTYQIFTWFNTSQNIKTPESQLLSP